MAFSSQPPLSISHGLSVFSLHSFFPSPKKPGLQIHSTDPEEPSQIALAWQPPLFEPHGSLMQVVPSPTKSVLQIQTALPPLFTHSASEEQSPLFSSQGFGALPQPQIFTVISP